MKDTKLIQTLHTFNKEEWLEFRKFLTLQTRIDSENFALFQKLQVSKDNFEKLGTPDRFRSKYFPHLTQKAFFNLLSKMYKWIEEWLVIHEMEKSKYDSDFYLLKALIHKGLIDEAKSVAGKLENKLIKSLGLSFTKTKKLEEIYYIMYFNALYDSKEEAKKYLLNTNAYNNLAFKEKNLFIQAEFLNRAKQHNADYSAQIDQLESINKYIDETELTNLSGLLPGIIKNEDVDKFQILYAALINNQFEADSDTQDFVYSYLSLYGSKFIMTGKSKNTDILFNLLNYKFVHNINMQNGKVDPMSFHNIVDLLGNFSSFEKTKTFIDNWIFKVQTKQILETKELAYSQICLIHGRYPDMLEYSRFIAFSDFGQKTRAWLHHVLAHYKLRKKHDDFAIQNLQSYKKFLRRNKHKFSDLVFSSQLNLLDILEKLMKNNTEKYPIKLTEYTNLFYRKWITKEVEMASKK